MVNHMLNKCKIRFTRRSKFACAAKARIVKEGGWGRPFCRVWRICNLDSKLSCPEVILFKSVIIEKIEILIGDIVHQHIHTSKVICCPVKFLSIVMPNCVFGRSTVGYNSLTNFQKHRGRTACRIAHIFYGFQTDSSKFTAKFWNSTRGKELTTLFAAVRGKKTYQNHIGCPEDIKLRIIVRKLNIVYPINDFRNLFCAVRDFFA